MRKSFVFLVAVGLAAFTTSAASAGTLTAATLTYSYNLSGNSYAAPFVASAAATGSSTAGTGTLGAGSAFKGTVTYHSVPIASTLHVFIKNNGKVTAHAGGTVSITAPITGTVVAGHLTAYLLKVPIAAGSVGTTHASFGGGLLRVTVFGSGWHTGNLSQTGFFTDEGVPQAIGTVLSTTPSGKKRIRVQTTGSFNLTANGAGTVKLVTLAHVVWTGLATSNSVAPTTLTLTYAAPEPGTLLLLGAGAAGMLAAGRRRRA
jgi:hypothetical protein